MAWLFVTGKVHAPLLLRTLNNMGTEAADVVLHAATQLLVLLPTT